jgi:molybdate transport system substrate-binding protein
MKGKHMRVVWLAALFAALVLPARAADVKIMVPGPIFAGMNALAQTFNTENGPAFKAVLIGGTVGSIQKNVAIGMSADIVILPAADMDALEKSGGVQSGSRVEMGRVGFGFAVRTGAPHPDISTPEKFRAVLLAAKSVSYNDPAIGSLGGVMVAQILARPEFAGVKAAPSGGARAVKDGNAEIALQSLSELVGRDGVELVGLVPAYLDAHMDFAAAVLSHATEPIGAAQFLHYITHPEATSVWKSYGVDR